MASQWRTESVRNARGQIAFGLVFFFLAGLAFSGFALDAGMILYRRSQMKNIVECAALTGADALIKGELSEGQVEQMVRDFIKLQCDKRGVSFDLQGTNVSFEHPNPQSPTTMVIADSKVKTDLLLSKFANIFSDEAFDSFFWSGVTSAAGTSRRPVILSLLIDTTGSMMSNIPNTSITKMDAAKQAAIAVVDALDYPQDQLAIISYAEQAVLVQAMTPVKTNVNALKSKIQALQASGSTNIADAIVMGRKQIEGASTTAGTDHRRIVILFTDGIPNTGIARFPDPRDRPDLVPLYGDNRAFFLDLTKLGHPPKEIFFRNDYITTTRSTSDNPPGYFEGWDPIGRKRTGVFAPALENYVTPYSGVTNSGAAVWCLNTWGYLDSKGNYVVGPQAWDPEIVAPAPILEADPNYAAGHIYMDMAIREADIVKDISHRWKEGVTFYSVGLGPKITVDDLGDPYQHAGGENAVREIFLRKLANDENAALDHEFIPGRSNLNAEQLKGRFFHTETAEEIRQAFINIINEELRIIRLLDPPKRKL